MNRAERRRMDKIQNNDRTFLYKESDIERIKQETTVKACERAFILMLGIPVMTLRDKYSFGKKRLETFKDYIFELYALYADDFLTLEELVDTIFEETGADFRLEEIEKTIGEKGHEKRRR